MVQRELNETCLRRDVVVAGGLLLLVLVAGSWRMAPGVCGVYHDDAIYVDSAHCLAQGDGYRLPHVPGAPRQTKYPIGYPGLLAIVWQIWPEFPQNLVAMQCLSLISGGLALAAGYLLLVRRGYFSRPTAAAAALLTGTSSSYLYFSTTTMAEMPFALVLVGAVWAIDRWLGEPEGSKPRSRLREWGVGALSALPLLCRTIGAPLIAVALWLAWRRGRRLGWVVAGAICSAGPWLLWSRLGQGSGPQSEVVAYYTDYVSGWSSTGVAMLWHVMIVNGYSAAHGVVELAAEGLHSWGGSAVYFGRPAVVLAAIGAIAWVAVLRRVPSGRLLPTFLAAYLGVLLVWSWPPYRFLVPIQLPLVAYLVEGLAATVCLAVGAISQGRRELRLPPGWAWAPVALLAAGNLALLGWHRQTVAETGYPLMRQGDEVVSWHAYQDLFA